MPLDRFVRFAPGTVPPAKNLRRLLVAYLGGAGSVRWHEGSRRWYLTLAGPYSDPNDARQKANEERARVIEVYPDGNDGYVNVMTRNADEFTNGAADRLGAVLCRTYGAKQDPT